VSFAFILKKQFSIYSFGIFYGDFKFYDHLVHVVFIWCIFSGLGIMYQENLAALVMQIRIGIVDRFLGV
jgi:hypothetical protein